MEESLEEQRGEDEREYGGEWRGRMGILKENLERLLGFWEVEKRVKLGFEEGEEEERSCISVLTD